MHYRKIKIHSTANEIDRSIERFSDALSTLLDKPIKDRLETPNPEDSIYRFISEASKEKEMLKGYAFIYDDKDPPLKLSTDFQEKSISYSELKGIKLNEKENLLKGVLFFMIIDEHIIIIPSKTFNIRSFEVHLNWLIQKSQESLKIIIEKPIKSTDKLDFNKNPIKKIKIDTMQELFGRTRKLSRREKVLKPVLEHIWPSAKEDKIKELSEDPIIDMSLEIKIKKNSTKWEPPDTNVAILNQHLRFLDDEDIKMELTDGTTINGGDINVKKRILVPIISNKNIDIQNLYKQMQDWYRKLYQDGIL